MKANPYSRQMCFCTYNRADKAKYGYQITAIIFLKYNNKKKIRTFTSSLIKHF